MTLLLVDPPVAEPVSPAEAKAHMRVETADEDALIGDLIAIARAHLEAETGLALLTQRWRLYLDVWPRGTAVLLRRTPVQAVEAIAVYDADGLPVAVDPGAARLDGISRPARLHLSEPPAPSQALNGIEIDFRAGFGDTAAAVPSALKQAIRMHVAHLHAFRGAVAPADQPVSVPEGYDRLLAPFRRRAI